MNDSWVALRESWRFLLSSGLAWEHVVSGTFEKMAMVCADDVWDPTRMLQNAETFTPSIDRDRSGTWYASRRARHLWRYVLSHRFDRVDGLGWARLRSWIEIQHVHAHVWKVTMWSRVLTRTSFTCCVTKWRLTLAKFVAIAGVASPRAASWTVQQHSSSSRQQSTQKESSTSSTCLKFTGVGGLATLQSIDSLPGRKLCW